MMDHPDTLEMERKGFLGSYNPAPRIKTFCKACPQECECEHDICDTCLEEAIADNNIRMEYIYSNRELTKQFFAFKKEYLNTDEYDQHLLLPPTIAWINIDPSHFADWYLKRL